MKAAKKLYIALAISVSVICILVGVLVFVVVKHNRDIAFDNSLVAYEANISATYTKLSPSDPEWWDTDAFDNFQLPGGEIWLYDKDGKKAINTEIVLPNDSGKPLSFYKKDALGDTVFQIAPIVRGKLIDKGATSSLNTSPARLLSRTNGTIISYRTIDKRIVKNATRFETANIIGFYDYSIGDTVDIQVSFEYVRITFWGDYAVFSSVEYSVNCYSSDIGAKLRQLYNFGEILS